MSDVYVAPDVAELNAKFGRPGHIQFVTGSGGQARVDMQYEGQRASLYLQGAHVTSYQANGEEVLWNSCSAQYQPGKAIRGGIPLCWPWFGAHPADPSLPQHGFARNSDFAVVAVGSDSEGTRLQLRLAPILRYDQWCADQGGVVDMLVDVRLSNTLYVQVTSVNLDAEQEVEQGIDRVYLSPPASMVLLDPVQNHTITLRAWGHKDMVVWNPGPVTAAAMVDFDDQGYRHMLCIEPALALDNTVLLAPGESHYLGQEIEVLTGAAEQNK